MMSETPIYLDHHATTPCDPRVVEKMVPVFTEAFGNPASRTHLHGRRAASMLEEARESVAHAIGARSSEIYFVSGATEGNNLVIDGIDLPAGSGMVLSAIEHRSVSAPAEQLARNGVAVRVLSPDRMGFIVAEQLGSAVGPATKLVSIIAANGEIGTIEPVEELASICQERSVPFHTDATQAVGKIPFDVRRIGCSFATFSAHKFYGPKGIGVVYVRSGQRLRAVTIGGGQERGLRSGTVNLPGAVGLAEALRLRLLEMGGEAARLTKIRNRLWDRLVEEIPAVEVHGPRENRLPGNLNASFDGVGAEDLMIALRRFSLSSGSACSSGDREPSPVLKAIGASDASALGSIRFGFGKSSTEEHVDLLVSELRQSVAKLREISAA